MTELVIVILVVGFIMGGLVYWSVMHPYESPRDFWFYGEDNDDKEIYNPLKGNEDD